MSTRQAAPAQMRLRAYAATPATVELTYRTARTRLVSALLVLMGCWLLAPVLFLIPPHLPWGLAAVAAGLFLAYRRWTGEYVVHSFQGACPSCGGALTLKADQQVKLPCTLPCFACHHEPELRLARADP